MKKALLIAAVFISYFTYAQDPLYTQYNYGWSMLNPAYAGSLACARAEIGYRLQWQGITGAPKTFNAAYDQFTKYGGAGFNYMHDGIGLMMTDRFDFNYSYPFRIGIDESGQARVVIQPGAQFSYYMKRLDTAGLIFSGPVETMDFKTRHVFDVSFGLLTYTKRLCIGLAAFHLTEPDEGFLGTSRLPRRYVVHASGIIGNADPDDKGLSVIPSAVYMIQGSIYTWFGMINVKFCNVNLGVGYRYQDALLLSAAYTWRDFTLGYSYDYTISELANYTNGSHEVHFSYRFMKDKWSSVRNLRQFI